jgi:predicted ester cyclase
VLALFAMFFTAFPDLRVEIHRQVTEDDVVATHKTFRGTHHGDFMGVAGTGHRVEFDVIDLLRVADGQLAEHWNVVDGLTLLTQVGVIPPLG